MRIGFFGDSFSHENNKLFQKTDGYNTYINLLEKEYNTKISINRVESIGNLAVWKPFRPITQWSLEKK